MAFVSNRENEGTNIGGRLRLNADVSVLKGTFKAGSIVRVVGNPDFRGEFECVDEDSGETVYLHPTLTSYSKV